MSARSSQVLHYGTAGATAIPVLLDRLQSAGATGINVNEEKTYELGNQESVDTTRDTPQVTYTLESQDMTTELEALICGYDPDAAPVDGFDFRDAVPIDLLARLKGDLTNFETAYGVVAPYSELQSAAYRFGVRANAGETFTFQGDSYFPTPGTPYTDRKAGNGATTTWTFDNGPALKTVEDGEDVYALCVTHLASDGTRTRLYFGDDYTNTTNGITLVSLVPAVGDYVLITYASATPLSVPQSIHPSSTLKPGGIRHRNIKMYVSDGAATPTFVRWLGVQSAEATWSVNREADEELGNSRYVAQDYDIPTVSGASTMRARDLAYLYARYAQITGTDTGDIPNILSSEPLELLYVITNPNTGNTFKSIYVEDARFAMPGLENRVQSKIEQNFTWTSDGGNMIVFNGDSGLI